LTVVWLGAALAQVEQAPRPTEEQRAPAAEISPPASANEANGKSSASGNEAKSNSADKKTETAAKKAKKQEHEPANPDTGASTLSGETLGLLPNPYERLGIKFTLSYIADALSNVAGGLRRGTVYEGRLNGAIDLDFAKSAGLRGLSFHANVFEIHGPALSRDYIGNLMPVSSLEAQATIRLYEAWLEQKFWNDKFSIRAGQLAADAEFMTSRFTNPFMAATYGWPAIFALNMPSGGPAPPLAAMGVRAKAVLNDNITLLGAIFDGNAAGPGTDSPESRDRYGINFRVTDPPLVIAEAQFAYNQQKTSPGLPGTVKFGGWYHAGSFNDQRFASNGLSQADPNASPFPAQLTSDFGVYSVFQQTLAAFAGKESERGIGVFTRASASPSDQNLINFYADAGVAVTGLSESRPADQFGVAVAYARISDRARALDRDFEVLAHDPRPIRTAETLITATYLAEIRKGWTVWPTVQYVIHPGGGYMMEGGVAKVVKDAVVVGARTVLNF
jgi:porin